MFWGLVLKANKKYTQTIKQGFHLSQAALDVSNSSDEAVQVVLTSDNHNYILCTLRKNKVEQVALDLNFGEGDEISFTSQGNGNVHLSGYLMPDVDDLDLMGEEESEDEKEEAETTQQLKKKKPEKAKGTPNTIKNKQQQQQQEEDEEDEDDSDFNESDEDEEGDDDDEDEDEDNEGEEEDDESSEEEEEAAEPSRKKAKFEQSKQLQNGLENGKVQKEKQKEKKKEKKLQKPQQQQQQQQDKSIKGGEKTLQGGVKIEDIRAGNGPEAKPGKKVQVYYEGRLKSNNKIFDSSRQGAGFKFNLGRNEVIKGWDIGVVGMKVGGKRKITCPPHMAYGTKGSPPVIPPNSTLVFDVELKAVN